MASNPVRILHLIASNFVGGPEKQILHHALNLRGSGFEVWIGSFRDQAEKAAILAQAEAIGLPTFESKSSGRFDPRAVFDLATFIKRERIQLLCTHGFKANSIGVFAKTLAGVPQMAFCRGWTAETLRVRAYEMLERRLLPFADRIVCVSEAQAEHFASRRWLRRRISVVHNAMLDSLGIPAVCDRAESKSQLGFSPQTRLVGVVGRLSVEKGQRYLVEAAKELSREFDDLKIILLGEGRERENLELQAKKLGVENMVVLPGFQSNVGTWMKAFDVVANCSLTEGIPNAVLEAMAAGTPVVATAVGGVPALVKDRETGLLVSPANAGALARGVAEALRDVEFASRLGHAGRAWVQERFSAAGQRDALLGLYRQCLGVSGISVDQPARNAASGSTEAASSASIQPFVSVIIPVRNEEAHLGAVLEDLIEQEYPKDRYEILVVDGQSTDGTSRVAAEVANAGKAAIRLLSNPGRRSSAGRNLGVQQSCGELIVFIDGHCHIPSKTLLRDAVSLFEKSGADCLSRPQPLNMRSNDLFQNGVAQARATALGHGRDSTIFNLAYEGPVNPSSAGALYRRRVFDRVGFYDESFDAAEDVEFNHRVLMAGLRSYISPRLAIEYQPRGSLGALWQQMVRYGKGRFRLIQKHRDAFSFSQLIPAILLLWLLLGVPASLLARPFSVAFGFSLAIYAAAVLFFSLRIGWRHGFELLLIAPAIFVTIHLGLGTGFLAQALKSGWGNSRAEKMLSASGSGNAKPLEPPFSVEI
jgi:succinoglycan biosynthesis protein ExoA